MSLKTSIRFILNNREFVALESPGRLALDYLRNSERLTGTKEGCKEGDCGACTVLMGSLENGIVRYVPMTSCLIPMGEVVGKHLVTIEGLNLETLSHVQEAMVDTGGTQCGYCTPGFVVAITGWLMDKNRPLNSKGAKEAISGNLCRCTGYRSIKEAGEQVIEKLSSKLSGENRISELCENGALPAYFETIPARLAKLQLPDFPNNEGEGGCPLMIAGGTDLYVQRGEDIPDQSVMLLNISSPINPIKEENGKVVVDARMSFQEFGDDPLIQAAIPDIQAYNELIASWPIRTRATLGGNICNASPIADMTCLLLALNADLHLESEEESRSVALKDFFLGYKQLAKKDEEMVRSVSFLKAGVHTKINWEKVSKRAVLDIATVNSAARFEMGENGVITDAHLALGGVAAIPLYLSKASQLLRNQLLTADLALAAIGIAQTEFTPISDVRGSADYKRLLARQLLLAHFLKCFPEVVSEEVVYAAL
ncbi:MAG: FAD binding domain-containing protein [Verrucomicrobia bacterium]|nr:FAD binding domain-containing protein [Verrucomicrobiota bacterium]MDA1066950.1 FAD binding domain-containing protein [Verrucomicrobiota bacterium]